MTLRSFALSTLSILVLHAHPALAQPTVAPGGTVVFTKADGSSIACRRLEPIDCNNGIVSASADANTNFVDARSLVPVTGVGVPNYATATVYNDFTVAGAPVDRVLDTQIDVTYDFFSAINVAALSKVEIDLSVSLVDITWGGPGIPVAATTLVHQNRTSDQGVTDVAQGSENNNLAGANAHFQAQLRRGHTYRVLFTVESLGEVSLLGVARAVGLASWRRLAVTIDEDEVELLGTHDADMKSLLATHDAAIKSLIAAHDADIKELLAEHDRDIKELLAQVIRLLNTPTGLRPEFPIK